MSTDNIIIMLSKLVLLATYLVQALQIFWLKVPSAGSTVEIFNRVRLDQDASRSQRPPAKRVAWIFPPYGGGRQKHHSALNVAVVTGYIVPPWRDLKTTNHPAAQVLQSRLKAVILITATATTTLVFLLPLIVELFPAVRDRLLPLIPLPQSSLRMAAVILLVIGNLVSTLGAGTLKKHVTFHDFGETKSLYTSGIYRFVRNPVSTGLVIMYAGFFCYLPSVVMAVGVAVVILNSRTRIRMEEIYLERTFGDQYRRYKQSTGKYFPKILS